MDAEAQGVYTAVRRAGETVAPRVQIELDNSSEYFLGAGMTDSSSLQDRNPGFEVSAKAGMAQNDRVLELSTAGDAEHAYPTAGAPTPGSSIAARSNSVRTIRGPRSTIRERILVSAIFIMPIPAWLGQPSGVRRSHSTDGRVPLRDTRRRQDATGGRGLRPALHLPSRSPRLVQRSVSALHTAGTIGTVPRYGAGGHDRAV